MKIAIIGDGYVGQAYKKLLETHYEIVMKGSGEPPTYEEVNACDLKLICVPTPMKDDGSCDTSIVNDVLTKLTGLVLIKSTVPPGFTARYTNKKEVCFSPEYVGEGKYFIPYWKYPHPTDIKYHDFMIVGGEKKIAEKIIDFFLPVLGTHVRYHITDSTTAEMVKYMENSWGATKVTFANEFYDICQRFGVSYPEARQLWLLDSRTEPMHTAVFKNKRGFGGKCFPKDVSAIVKHCEEAGYYPDLLNSVLRVNKHMTDKNE